jgi:hypothetical protein
VQFAASFQIAEDHGQQTRLKWRESLSSSQPHSKYQRIKNLGPDGSGDWVQLAASFQIPEDQGPRNRLKCRGINVCSIISNTSGPRTKDQTEVEIKCNLKHHCKYHRTREQRPDWSGEQVQFAASLKITEDQGPDWNGVKCSLQLYFKYQRTKDQDQTEVERKLEKFAASFHIPEDQEPRNRLKCRLSAVCSINLDTRVPRTKDQLTILKCGPSAVCSIISITKGPRTMLGPDWSGEQVQFSALFQIPGGQVPRTKDQGPRTNYQRQKTKDQGLRTKLVWIASQVCILIL